MLTFYRNSKKRRKKCENFIILILGLTAILGFQKFNISINSKKSRILAILDHLKPFSPQFTCNLRHFEFFLKAV